MVAAGQLQQGCLVLLHFVLRLYQLEKLAPQLAQLHIVGTSIARLGSAQGVCCSRLCWCCTLPPHQCLVLLIGIQLHCIHDAVSASLEVLQHENNRTRQHEEGEASCEGGGDNSTKHTCMMASSRCIMLCRYCVTWYPWSCIACSWLPRWDMCRGCYWFVLLICC